MDGNGKDDGATIIHKQVVVSAKRPALPLKLLLLAVLATGFLAVAVIFLSGFTYSMLPRFSFLLMSSAPLLSSSSSSPLERWITTRSPATTTAWHNMTDDELRWAATWHPAIATYPYKRVPKVAFMFLTHGPLPLAPLWEKFFSGATSNDLYSVYIHASPDYTSSSAAADEFSPESVFYRRHVPSQAVEWGQPTMVDAERRLLANALLDLANDRFVLLSESCVPLFNFSVVYRYITGSNHSFVGAVDDPGPGGRGRYSGELAPEVSPKQWRKGAQWFELHRDLAVLVVADDRYYPKFGEHCRPGCYMDEHYLPTVMSVEAPARIANRSVTWVDWSGGGAHPTTFGEANVDEAFLTRQTTVTDQGKCTYNGQPSDVCFLFSRKFAADTLQPMLKLAPKMLGYG
ncbi:hypothetical protein HU200_060889 [Digitaria exilis]|uniref:Uncharacterized protein n=1 Tax=Digitaria exilis TaxID=1010633 RepID=A0A835AIJ2_9POAL|nr:hypothetical protein HU200_060889 [Digitaria exilis]